MSYQSIPDSTPRAIHRLPTPPSSGSSSDSPNKTVSGAKSSSPHNAISAAQTSPNPRKKKSPRTSDAPTSTARLGSPLLPKDHLGGVLTPSARSGVASPKKVPTVNKSIPLGTPAMNVGRRLAIPATAPAGNRKPRASTARKSPSQTTSTKAAQLKRRYSTPARGRRKSATPSSVQVLSGRKLGFLEREVAVEPGDDPLLLKGPEEDEVCRWPRMSRERMKLAGISKPQPEAWSSTVRQDVPEAASPPRVLSRSPEAQVREPCHQPPLPPHSPPHSPENWDGGEAFSMDFDGGDFDVTLDAPDAWASDSDDDDVEDNTAGAAQMMEESRIGDDTFLHVLQKRGSGSMSTSTSTPILGSRFQLGERIRSRSPLVMPSSQDPSPTKSLHVEAESHEFEVEPLDASPPPSPFLTATELANVPKDEVVPYESEEQMAPPPDLPQTLMEDEKALEERQGSQSPLPPSETILESASYPSPPDHHDDEPVDLGDLFTSDSNIIPDQELINILQKKHLDTSADSLESVENSIIEVVNNESEEDDCAQIASAPVTPVLDFKKRVSAIPTPNFTFRFEVARKEATTTYEEPPISPAEEGDDEKEEEMSRMSSEGSIDDSASLEGGDDAVQDKYTAVDGLEVVTGQVTEMVDIITVDLVTEEHESQRPQERDHSAREDLASPMAPVSLVQSESDGVVDPQAGTSEDDVSDASSEHSDEVVADLSADVTMEADPASWESSSETSGHEQNLSVADQSYTMSGDERDVLSCDSTAAVPASPVVGFASPDQLENSTIALVHDSVTEEDLSTSGQTPSDGVPTPETDAPDTDREYEDQPQDSAVATYGTASFSFEEVQINEAQESVPVPIPAKKIVLKIIPRGVVKIEPTAEPVEQPDEISAEQETQETEPESNPQDTPTNLEMPTAATGQPTEVQQAIEMAESDLQQPDNLSVTSPASPPALRPATRSTPESPPPVFRFARVNAPKGSANSSMELFLSSRVKQPSRLSQFITASPNSSPEKGPIAPSSSKTHLSPAPLASTSRAPVASSSSGEISNPEFTANEALITVPSGQSTVCQLSSSSLELHNTVNVSSTSSVVEGSTARLRRTPSVASHRSLADEIASSAGGDESRWDGSFSSIVEVSSLNPRAAARAAAILKMVSLYLRFCAGIADRIASRRIIRTSNMVKSQ